MNGKSLRKWILYVCVVVLLTASGNWLRQQFSPTENGPLADVTWTTGTEANQVHISIIDEKRKPLGVTLITIVTDDGVFDVMTNNQGAAQTHCDGKVVTAVRANRRLVFSKALAEITGSPSLAAGLKFEIVAKRPDLLIPKLPTLMDNFPNHKEHEKHEEH